MSDNNPLRPEHFLARNVSRDYTAISERIVARYAELFPNYVFTDIETSLDLMAAEIHTLRMERGEVATQTVGISGASAAMQAGGMPRRDQHLPDATSPSCKPEPDTHANSQSLQQKDLGAILERKTAEIEAAGLCHWDYQKPSAACSTGRVINEVLAQCAANDEEWGGPKHDDTHKQLDWIGYIRKQCTNAIIAIPAVDHEKRLINIAALAAQAVQSSRRKRNA